MKTYFFLNSKLHKFLRSIRQENIIVAWSFEDEERLWYDASMVKRDHTNAYRITEVAEFFNKRSTFIRSLIGRKILDRPSGQAYNIATRKPGMYYWSEEDVLDIRNKLYEILPKNEFNEPMWQNKLISDAELRAKMRQDNSMYIRDKEGNFVKVWRNI